MKEYAAGDKVKIDLRSTHEGVLDGEIMEKIVRRSGSIGYHVKTKSGEYIVDAGMVSQPAQQAEYVTITDRKGQQLHPGDRVRIRLHPRGSLEGTIVISKTAVIVLPDGTEKKALSVRDEIDGKLYQLNSKGALKLKV